MERRYMVATLAIIVTFATFSSGFRSLQQLSQQRGQHCTTLSRWVAAVKSHLHPAYPEEAQLLAEMNLPPVAAQTRVAEPAMEQSQAAAQCARESAIREADRARRDARRMREEIARETRVSVAPVVVDLRGLDGLDQRIQIKTANIARRIALQNAKVQIATAKLQAVSMRTLNAGQHRSPCSGRADIQ